MTKGHGTIQLKADRATKVPEDRLVAFKRAMTEKVVKPMEKRAAEQREEATTVRARQVR